MSVLKYSGKRVLVTGSAAGIGRAVAMTLVTPGAEVHRFDRNTADIALRSFRAVDLRDVSEIDPALAELDGRFDSVALSPTHGHSTSSRSISSVSGT